MIRAATLLAGLATCLAMGLLTDGVAVAQTPDADERAARIASFASTLPVERIGDLLTGSLGSGQTTTFDIDVDPRKAYAVAGVCSNCLGIMLVATNAEDGAEIGKHQERNRVGVMLISPLSGAKIRIKISMAGCKVETCAWSTGVFVEKQ